MKILLNDEKRFFAIFAGTFLGLTLLGNVPARKSNSEPINTQSSIEELSNEETLSDTSESVLETNNDITEVEVLETTNDNLDDEADESLEDNLADSYAYEYINSLKNEFLELKSYASDKWNSPEFQEKLATYKQNLKILFDFIFNGGNIKGYTFSDLSEEAKTNVKRSFSELDEMINYFIPDYKERLYEWLVDKGADGLEALNNFKEKFSDYKDNVLDEYENRTSSSNTKILIKK